MVATQTALALIAIAVVTGVLLLGATIYYTSKILTGEEDHEHEGNTSSGGRPT